MMQVDADLKEQERKRTVTDNMKRYFYSLVSQNKKLLGQKHPGYYVNTNKMFIAVVQQNIPTDNWIKFVGDEMSQRPEKWKDDKLVERINEIRKKRGLGKPSNANDTYEFWY